MKILFALLLVCIVTVAAKPYRFIGGDLETGVDLPFLGRISMGVGGGLDFNGGLFGVGKNIIHKFLGMLGLRPRPDLRDTWIGRDSMYPNYPEFPMYG